VKDASSFLYNLPFGPVTCGMSLRLVRPRVGLEALNGWRGWD
jgi:hypothetical protein